MTSRAPKTPHTTTETISAMGIPSIRKKNRTRPSKRRSRDHTKNSGESTPAGDVLLESGNPLPRTIGCPWLANVNLRLPRMAQSLVVYTCLGICLPLSDDKKGVVYAELALGEQTSTEKPPPPSTEYAEIVYTDQPKDNKETN
ncbi:hypothetical protein HF086_007659 [Spodoptera exigua]|uniref:Uncharacterized protein n=1 Tax=Spodoptera exigua TaxID=7107 RepID=A0A922MAV0_SPOEX|nr:hypothetical protein HF086_007659 [Spodoptera exigua]